MSSSRRLLLALLWLALLAVAGWRIGQRLELSGDLRKFMPAHAASRSPVQLHAARGAEGHRALAREAWT
jgi:predicted exporter